MLRPAPKPYDVVTIAVVREPEKGAPGPGADGHPSVRPVRIAGQGGGIWPHDASQVWPGRCHDAAASGPPGVSLPPYCARQCRVLAHSTLPALSAGFGGTGCGGYCAPATSPPYRWDAYNLPPIQTAGPPMKDLTETERRTLYRMPHSVRATFLLWRIGINPRYTIAAETYRRHRAKLAEEYGIDITALP